MVALVLIQHGVGGSNKGGFFYPCWNHWHCLSRILVLSTSSCYNLFSESATQLFLTHMKNVSRCNNQCWAIWSASLAVQCGPEAVMLHFFFDTISVLMSDLLEDTSYWALHVHTTFSGHNHISGSQQCQAVLTHYHRILCTYPLKLKLCRTVKYIR